MDHGVCYGNKTLTIGGMVAEFSDLYIRAKGAGSGVYRQKTGAVPKTVLIHHTGSIVVVASVRLAF